MKLRQIAHGRSGDKGTIANISLIAFRAGDYSRLVAHVTAARVRERFAGLVTGEVRRYEMPSIGALNFVLHGMADGGVTRTLALDAHGKSLSSALLDMEIPDAGASR
ncbi:MAG: hypothetical protein ABI672_04450 [Vicinamibacteria bacterium]